MITIPFNERLTETQVAAIATQGHRWGGRKKAFLALGITTNNGYELFLDGASYDKRATAGIPRIFSIRTNGAVGHLLHTETLSLSRTTLNAILTAKAADQILGDEWLFLLEDH